MDNNYYNNMDQNQNTQNNQNGYNPYNSNSQYSRGLRKKDFILL